MVSSIAVSLVNQNMEAEVWWGKSQKGPVATCTFRGAPAGPRFLTAHPAMTQQRSPTDEVSTLRVCLLLPTREGGCTGI